MLLLLSNFEREPVSKCEVVDLIIYQATAKVKYWLTYVQQLCRISSCLELCTAHRRKTHQKNRQIIENIASYQINFIVHNVYHSSGFRR